MPEKTVTGSQRLIDAINDAALPDETARTAIDRLQGSPTYADLADLMYSQMEFNTSVIDALLSFIDDDRSERLASVRRLLGLMKDQSTVYSLIYNRALGTTDVQPAGDSHG